MPWSIGQVPSATAVHGKPGLSGLKQRWTRWPAACRAATASSAAWRRFSTTRTSRGGVMGRSSLAGDDDGSAGEGAGGELVVDGGGLPEGEALGVGPDVAGGGQGEHLHQLGEAAPVNSDHR